MRLVPNQGPDEITKKFKDHFEKIAPPSVKVKVTPHHGGEPAVVPVDSDEYRAAAIAMEKAFGKKALRIKLPHFLVYGVAAIAQLFSVFSCNLI